MKKLILVVFLALSVTALFAGEHGKNCKMKDASLSEAKSVDMTGKLLCKHCNLHLQENCEKVFQPSNDEAKLYPICEASKGDLEAMSDEGKAIVHVKGKIVKCEKDGKEELLIEEITKVDS